MSKQQGPDTQVKTYFTNGEVQRGIRQMEAQGYRVESVVDQGRHSLWGNRKTMVIFRKVPAEMEPTPASTFSPEEIAAIQARDAANTAKRLAQ